MFVLTVDFLGFIAVFYVFKGGDEGASPLIACGLTPKRS
jgi:hypothetical protein